MINIPIEIGDIVLGGRFKNKKILVKEIGTDQYGTPTINGRPILKVRMPKLYIKENYMNNVNIDKQIEDLRTEKENILPRIEAISKEIKKKFGNVDISEPMSDEEKKLTKERAKLWSDVNTINKKINSLKKTKMTESIDTSIHVKIKKDKEGFNIYLETVDGLDDIPLNKFPFETKELALLNCQTKGYVCDDVKLEPYQPKQPKLTKHEPTKFDKPKEIKLSKEKEIKLENFIRKIIGEMSYNKAMKFANSGRQTKSKFHGYALDKNERRGTPNLSLGFYESLQDLSDYDGMLEIINYYRKYDNETEKMLKVNPNLVIVGDRPDFDVLESKLKTYKSVSEIKLENFIRKTVLSELKRLNELDVSGSEDLTAKAKRLAELANEMKILQAKLQTIEKEYGELDDEFRGMVEAVGTTKDTFIEAGNVLIKIERAAYDRASPKYKEGFAWLHERVNKTMKDLADEAMKMVEGTAKIKSKISVVFKENQNLEEAPFGNIISKIKGWWNKKLNSILNLNKKAQSDLDVLAKKFGV